MSLRFLARGGNESRLMKRHIPEPEQLDQPPAFSKRSVGRIAIVCLLYFTQQFPRKIFWVGLTGSRDWTSTFKQVVLRCFATNVALHARRKCWTCGHPKF